MRNYITTAIIALAALALAGCGGFGGTKPEPIIVVTEKPATLPAMPILVEDTFPASAVTAIEPIKVPVERDVTTFIPVGTLLDKVVESGCEIQTITYREIKRGGGIKIECREAVDLLNVDLGEL